MKISKCVFLLEKITLWWLNQQIKRDGEHGNVAMVTKTTIEKRSPKLFWKLEVP